MDKTTTIIIGILLIFIMLGMGLSLVPNDFKNILKHPKAIVIGLINQLLILPIIGFCIAYYFPMDPEIAVGLMILAACPGGATSNLICFLAKADLALSVSLTAISSIISVFTIPLIINFSINFFMEENQSVQLSLLETIIQIAVVILIPVIVGMSIRYFKPDFAIKAEKSIRTLSSIILSILIVGILIKEKSNLINYIEQSGVPTILLNTSTILIGFLSAKLLGLRKKQALTISIESGVQNSTLAISIAIVLLQKTSFAITPSIYTLVMYVTSLLIIFFSLKTNTTQTD